MAQGTVICSRCKGSGWIPAFTHCDLGKCWTCGGTGIANVGWKTRTKKMMNWIAEIKVSEAAPLITAETAKLLKKKFISPENANEILKALADRLPSLPTKAELEEAETAARRERWAAMAKARKEAAGV